MHECVSDDHKRFPRRIIPPQYHPGGPVRPVSLRMVLSSVTLSNRVRGAMSTVFRRRGASKTSSVKFTAEMSDDLLGLGIRGIFRVLGYLGHSEYLARILRRARPTTAMSTDVRSSDTAEASSVIGRLLVS